MSAFAQVTNGQPEIFRGALGTPALVEYVSGLLKIDGKDRPGLLRYCFDSLEHEESVIRDLAKGRLSNRVVGRGAAVSGGVQAPPSPVELPGDSQRAVTT